MCILYKKINGEEKSLGTKNLLDYQAQSKSSTEVDGSSGGNITMDSFVKRSSMKVSEKIRKNMQEHTSILVTMAHLPYCFVEQDTLKEFAQAFVNLGASYGRVSAEQFIVGRLTACKDIVSKLNIVQEAIRQALVELSKQSTVSFTTDLWSDNIATHTYLDVTFFWAEESGPDKRKWLLKHVMYT